MLVHKLWLVLALLIAMVAQLWADVEVIFSQEGNVTIKNSGSDYLPITGREWGTESTFIPGSRAYKKIGEAWSSYSWDWCGVGMTQYILVPGKELTFPYKYHLAQGHIKVELMGKTFEFENQTGLDIPTPKERKDRAEKLALSLENDLAKIKLLPDVKQRIVELEKLLDRLKDVYPSAELNDISTAIRIEISVNKTFLEYGITHQEQTVKR